MTVLKDKPVWLRIVIVLVIACAFASLALFFYQSIRNFFKFAQIDFTSYVRASGWFFDGDNPYQAATRRYLYPLFLLLVVYPLTFLQQSRLASGLSIALWSAGSLAAFFAVLGAVWRYLYNYASAWKAVRDNLLPAALMVVMLHPFLQDEFLNGQVNLYVMSATAAFFIFLVRDKQFAAGVMLAIAVSIKISPALCLLCVLFSGQYRAAVYAVVMIALLTVILPSMVNSQSLDYYRFVYDDILPRVSGSDIALGFNQFSIVGTFSSLFSIHWNPLAKVAVLGVLALGMTVPLKGMNSCRIERTTPRERFTAFAALVSIIPLIFPMSEPHHLLLHTIPFLATLAFWRDLIQNRKNLLRDGLSLLFLTCVVGLQIGHGLKETPIRLLSLFGIYIGMIWLLVRFRTERRSTDAPAI